ncbi:class I SAM-dependent methyltransferase [Neolewinella agarilytica]|uniref:Methyltransferase domain-containing protein n=1 Tax=Neolewinella agarilytica TaxID=478744 RepID=A0A1H9KQ43_9BACT|nr:class I SAM-dependent methyltransferase [Neolewinella agarilytica]SER01280.1 Methyltransferase domain-containing protein [Neolewinella agarilytica]
MAKNGVLCSQPKLELTVEEAKAYINRRGFYAEELRGKKVLCLASGGGQQSIAFALLGAEVTVVDFSELQLEKDRLVSEQYGKEMRVVKSDMRDLSFCADEEFDVVYQPYSINYIPEVGQVFDEVARVLKQGGLYDIMFHNPYVHGSWKNGCWEEEWATEELWEGKGYPIWQPYKDGYPIRTVDPHWRFTSSDNERVKLESPQEYRHTMSTIVNGLIARGLAVERYEEETADGAGHPPGNWEHYKSCLPPWIYLLSRKRGGLVCPCRQPRQKNDTRSGSLRPRSRFDA